MSAAELDLDARYSVDGYPGIAFYLIGYETDTVEVETVDVDHAGEPIYFYDLEEVENHDRVTAVMVGDDRRHSVGVDELTLLDDLAYCAECGAIGCGHDGRDRS